MPIANIAGRELHFVNQGSGPLVVLIHGYPLDHTMWLDQLSGLAGVRTVVALDLPGYGMSERVTGQPLTMDRLADDVAGLIGELGEASADVVGLSMGGYVALALWDRHPQLVTTLALSNTRATADSEEARAGRDAQALAVVSEGRGPLASRLVDALLSPAADLTAKARLRTMVESTPVETMVASLRGMAERPDRTELLSSIAVPTLAIAGEEDGLIPPLDMHELAAAISGSEFVVVPGAGHLPPIERPDAFTDILLDFWN